MNKLDPSNVPTLMPSNEPTLIPSIQPTLVPSNEPSLIPSNEPTLIPSNEPTLIPSNEPTCFPSNDPTLIPTIEPTSNPVVVYEYGEADTVECDPPETTVVSPAECEEASNFLGANYMGSGAWPILHGCAAELEDAGNRIWFNENTQGSAKPHRRPVCKIEVPLETSSDTVTTLFPSTTPTMRTEFFNFTCGCSIDLPFPPHIIPFISQNFFYSI